MLRKSWRKQKKELSTRGWVIFLRKIAVILRNVVDCVELRVRNTVNICLTSLTRAKCGIPSTWCWKILNISGSIELFAL